MSRQVHSPDYVGEDRRASSGWHLNKNVSITQIIGLVSAIIVSAMAWQNLNNRVAQVEAEDMRLRQRITELREERKSDADALERRLGEITNKIDDIKNFLMRDLRENKR